MTAADGGFGRWLASPPPGEEIVISGISGRFPESNNVYEFQNNLLSKTATLTEDERRWRVDEPGVPRRFGKTFDIEKFDAGYFGIHQRQADVMNPMMKKALETAVEAILDAGINPSELKGTKTGVFSVTTYPEVENATLKRITEQQNFGMTGRLRSMISTRISYFLKVRGPSYGVDTGCSGSMCALESAFRAMRLGQCDNAVVVGTNLLLHPNITRQLYKLGVLSEDGACKAFSEKADGYVRSEAVVSVFLQKAKSARRIQAKIVHIKPRTDGYKPEGITVPSAQTQEDLITDVLKDIQADPSDIYYVEVHGTGTSLGDPKEVQAIDNAIAKKSNFPLRIGGNKNNIGHTEASSGLCSLIKIVIALYTGFLPPTLTIGELRKELIGFQEGRLELVTEIEKIECENALMAINSLGWGGTNYHMVLQRYNKKKTASNDDLEKLVFVSGRTKEAVLKILDGLDQKPVDIEFVGLLNQIFKNDIAGHLYRGYIILGGNNHKKSVKFHQHQENSLVLFFDNFEQKFQVVGQHLIKIPYFMSIMERAKDVLLKQKFEIFDVFFCWRENQPNFVAFLVQLGVTELLKFLQIPVILHFENLLYELVNLYHQREISFEETVIRAYKIITLGDISSGLNGRRKKLTRRNLEHSNYSILNVSDKPIRTRSKDMVLTQNFLEILGKLYQYGHNPQIHKLYPEVAFPVSRNTPLISPLIKWNYDKWYSYKNSNQESFIAHRCYQISSEDYSYLTGYTLDERNLIPPTEILNLVWQTLLSDKRVIVTDQAVVFENCNFRKSVPMSKTKKVEISVMIHHWNGKFHVFENEDEIASGKIFLPDKIQDHFLNLEAIIWNEGEILTKKEIYTELNLRGYDYSGMFKGIEMCNIEGTVGKIRWENNWSVFLDNMIQMMLLQTDNESLKIPVGIRKLIIDPSNHLKETISKQNLCPVYVYEKCRVVKSCGIELYGVATENLEKRASVQVPVLQKQIFIPNTTNLDLMSSLRVNTQLIIENTLEKKIRAIEVVDDFTKPNSEVLLPIIKEILEKETLLVTSDFTIWSKTRLEKVNDIKVKIPDKNLPDSLLLIIGTKILERSELLKELSDALLPEGFILTREEINFVSENIYDVKIVSEHVTGDEKLILFRKLKTKEDEEFIRVSWRNLEWLPKLQEALKQEKRVVVYCHNREPEGVLGLTNCIRLEPGGDKVRCFFIMDEDVPEFDPKLQFYQDQIKKNFAVNIFRKKKWGTYRLLNFEKTNKFSLEKEALKTPAFNCLPDKSYIIVGGLGGFGLELAEWLISRGAKKLILISRIGVRNGYQARKIHIWTSKGVTVKVTTDDLTTSKGCLHLLQEANKIGPIDAIFNLSLVLKDALFVNQTEEMFLLTLAPKAEITTNLDLLTRVECPHLRYFVMFSSVTSGQGCVGQSNYGMGNSIMERICEKRREENLPGLAIQWGAVGDVGFVARTLTLKNSVIRGTIQQDISSCLEVLDKFLAQSHHVVCSYVVAEKDKKDRSLNTAVDVVLHMLGIKKLEAVNKDASLAELGIDSMSGTQLVQSLKRDFGICLGVEEARSLTLPQLLEMEERILQRDSHCIS